MSREPISALRCLLVWVALSGAAAAGAALAWPAVALLPESGRDFAGLLAGSAGAVALPALAWSWLSGSLLLLHAVRGRTTSRWCPAPLRRVLLGCCGVALTGGLTGGLVGSAYADQPRPLDVHVVAALPLPDRATGGPAPHPAPAARQVADPLAGGPVAVVRPGDSLWSIAERLLPAGATDAQITATWHLIHRRNRDVIGPDPDLLLPGQRLRLPPPSR